MKRRKRQMRSVYFILVSGLDRSRKNWYHVERIWDATQLYSSELVTIYTRDVLRDKETNPIISLEVNYTRLEIIGIVIQICHVQHSVNRQEFKPITNSVRKRTRSWFRWGKLFWCNKLLEHTGSMPRVARFSLRESINLFLMAGREREIVEIHAARFASGGCYFL